MQAREVVEKMAVLSYLKHSKQCNSIRDPSSWPRPKRKLSKSFSRTTPEETEVHPPVHSKIDSPSVSIATMQGPASPSKRALSQTTLPSWARTGSPCAIRALLPARKSLLDNYRGALRSAGLDTYAIRPHKAEDRAQPGVRMATMHRAKGLEFNRVIVAGVREGIVPHRRALQQAGDQADRKQRLKRERSLLYVAVTRAKRDVVITSHGVLSPWLEALR